MDPEKKADEEIELLEKAFKDFNRTTQKLRESYGDLQGKLDKVNLKLAEKNKKLEKSLEENKKIRKFLDKLIENMPVGMIFIDINYKVKHFNQYADKIFNLQNSKGVLINKCKNFLDQIVSETVKSIEAEIEVNEKILKIYFKPIKDEQKLLEGILINFRDITKEKELEKKVMRKNKYEALGEMSAIMAHELKTPIAGIEGMLSLLKKDLKEDENKSSIIKRITKATRNMTQIISDLLTYTRPLNPKKEKINIGKQIRRIVSNMNNLGKIKINIDSVKNINWNFDKMLFKRMVFNLINNAVESLGEKGEVIINTEQKNDSMIIEISDNGKGIKEENINKIFKPFFTTKSKGTGLGLSFVKRIVESHNGKIDIDSKKDKGTTFNLMFRR